MNSKCYLNDALLVYISVDQKEDHTGYGGGFITLERDDVGKLIQILQDAKQVMDAEAESLEPPPVASDASYSLFRDLRSYQVFQVPKFFAYISSRFK